MEAGNRRDSAGKSGYPSKPQTRERSILSWVFSLIAALFAVGGLAFAILADEEDNSAPSEIDITSLLAPPTRTPMDTQTVLASFANAHSIPLTYVNEARPVAKYSAEELQVGDGGYLRLRMTITNRGDEPLGLGATYSYGILSDGRGFHFSVYEGVTLTDPDEGLPDSLQPGETWSGWVYLISYPPGVVFFTEGGREFILELSSESGRARFRQFIPLQ